MVVVAYFNKYVVLRTKPSERGLTNSGEFCVETVTSRRNSKASLDPRTI